MVLSEGIRVRDGMLEAGCRGAVVRIGDISLSIAVALKSKSVVKSIKNIILSYPIQNNFKSISSFHPSDS